MNLGGKVVRVIVVGDIVTDIVAIHSGAIATGSDTPATITVSGGGSAANTAAWLARLGVPVDLVGVVGCDQAGDERIAELTRAGVGCAHIRRTKKAATGSIIVLTHGRERSMLSDRGANLHLQPSDVDSVLVSATSLDHLHLSGYPLLDAGSRPAGRHALAAAREKGIRVSVDAASAAPLRAVGGSTFLDWITGTDLLLANLDEARELIGETTEPLVAARKLARTANSVVVKLGSAGAVWSSVDGSEARAPALPATSVDPTGAGDAFAAGLLAAWLNGSTVDECLAAGVRLGAEAVTVVGGRPPAAHS